MNKTAGVFVKDFMIKHLGAKVNKYKHAPIRMLDEKYQNLMKIGVIRNPFAWYVSYYTYLTKNKLLTTMNFPKFVYTYTQHPRALLDFMGRKIRKQWENLYPPKTNLPIGSWTFHYINYFSNNAREILTEWDIFKLENELDKVSSLDVLMKTETLKDNMISVFGEEYQDAIYNFPRRNISNNKPYQEFYNDYICSMIEQKDRILMEYLGYAFE